MSYGRGVEIDRDAISRSFPGRLCSGEVAHKENQNELWAAILKNWEEFFNSQWKFQKFEAKNVLESLPIKKASGLE